MDAASVERRNDTYTHRARASTRVSTKVVIIAAAWIAAARTPDSTGIDSSKYQRCAPLGETAFSR